MKESAETRALKILSETVDQLKMQEAIEFGEWLVTFESLEKTNGAWCVESQVSTSLLYMMFKKEQDEKITQSLTPPKITTNI